MLKKRTDFNQKYIVKDLRALGISVADLSGVGGGIPDLLIGWQGNNYLIEIKTLTGKLNNLQTEFFGSWKGNKYVCRSLNEIIEIIKGIQIIK